MTLTANEAGLGGLIPPTTPPTENNPEVCSKESLERFPVGETLVAQGNYLINSPLIGRSSQTP